MTVVSNQGDLFRIDSQSFETGLAEASVKASKILENLKFDFQVALDESTFACLGPVDQLEMLYADSATTQSKLNRLPIEASHPACRPLAINGDLIVPSSDGQIARLNPKTAGIVGTPFQPPISPGSRIPWLEPTLISPTRLAIAKGQSSNPRSGNSAQDNSALYILNAENPQALHKVSELVLESTFKSRLLSDGGTIFGVVSETDHDRLIAISTGDQPAIEQTVDLPGRVVAGPWLLEQGILLKMDNDQLVMWGRELSMNWSVAVANDLFAGAPQNIGTQILLAFRSGKLMVVEPSSGRIDSEFELGQPIIHQPLTSGQLIYFCGLDGTVHVADLAAIMRNK